MRNQKKSTNALGLWTAASSQRRKPSKIINCLENFLQRLTIKPVNLAISNRKTTISNKVIFLPLKLWKPCNKVEFT